MDESKQALKKFPIKKERVTIRSDGSRRDAYVIYAELMELDSEIIVNFEYMGETHADLVKKGHV